MTDKELFEIESRDFRDFNEPHSSFDRAYDGWKQCFLDRRTLIKELKAAREVLFLLRVACDSVADPNATATGLVPSEVKKACEKGLNGIRVIA